MSKPLNNSILEYVKDGNISSELLIKQILRHPNILNILNLFHYEFLHHDFLIQAITHSSFLNESDAFCEHNEKLEFLGDSVLNILVSSVIFQLYPDASEGELSKLRSALVCEESLIKLSHFLKLDRVILLGKGELSTLKYSPAVLADCFEALLGAIYLDRGFQAVQFSFDHLMSKYLDVEGEQFIHFDNLLEYDAKSILQEKTMKEFKELPEYVYEQLEDQNFRVSVRIKGMILAEAIGPSKKKGAKAVAKKVLQEKLLDQIIYN